jgi:hypothetical protein
MGPVARAALWAGTGRGVHGRPNGARRLFRLRWSSLVARLLRLTLLAPEIVEAILDGHVDEAVKAAVLRGGVPMEWDAQQRSLKFT